MVHARSPGEGERHDLKNGPACDSGGAWKALGDKSEPFIFDGVHAQHRGRSGCSEPVPWQGVMVNSRGERVATVKNGVIDFTRGHMWSESGLAALREQGWVPRNWSKEWEHARSLPARMSICERALQTGGPILELAAGPGGGNLSPFLHLDPAVPLIVNDIEPAILHMWREFLEEQMGYTGCFVAFDACREWPVLDHALACISSTGGLSNLEGVADKFLVELARVLKPGGILVAIEMQLTQDTLMRMPDEFKLALPHDYPFIAGSMLGWATLLERVGLDIHEDTVFGGRTLRPEGDSGLAKEALKYGVTLDAEFHCIVASRPMGGARTH